MSENSLIADWSIPVGTHVKWDAVGHGVQPRQGEIVAHLPAGASLLGVAQACNTPCVRAVLDISGIDRYVVKVPKLTQKNKNPVPGKMVLMTPSRWTFEKNVTEVSDGN